MPVQIIDGDLFQTNAKYICHQVNCQARMGSGVAKQVRAKYPEVYNAYGETIAMPFKIGCGLGGGDWNVILGLIQKELSDKYTVELWRKEV